MEKDFYCAEILSGKTRVEIILETENVLAFQHTRPAYPIHIVVIPKKHVESFVTLNLSDATLCAEMMNVIQRISKTALIEHGACRVITNLGAYRESKHLHWHIVSGERIRKSAKNTNSAN